MKSMLKSQEELQTLEHTRYHYQYSKNNELVKSLKNCTEQVILLFQICSITPKTLDIAKDIIEYCRSLEKMLKSVVQAVPNRLINIQIHQRLQKEYQQLNSQHERALKENKQYKCELSVLETKLSQAENRQKKLSEEKQKQKQNVVQFQNKLNRIKKDSEEGLKKIIQSSKPQQNLRVRNNSLPVLKTYANREKMGLLLLMDNYKKHHPKHQSLISSMKRQY